MENALVGGTAPHDPAPKEATQTATRGCSQRHERCSHKPRSQEGGFSREPPNRAFTRCGPCSRLPPPAGPLRANAATLWPQSPIGGMGGPTGQGTHSGPQAVSEERRGAGTGRGGGCPRCPRLEGSLCQRVRSSRHGDGDGNTPLSPQEGRAGSPSRAWEQRGSGGRGRPAPHCGEPTASAAPSGGPFLHLPNSGACLPQGRARAGPPAVGTS